MCIACLNLKLSQSEKKQVFLDYYIPCAFINILILFNFCNIIPLWINKAILFSFFICAPFEYIQPKLGWVYYYKCIMYKLEPFHIMWIIQSLWDSIILLLLLGIAICLFSTNILYNYNSNAAIFMSSIGMIQEILLESTQTIWFYKPNKFNPTWAVINGRNMTLQQWHWSILPTIYYKYIIYLLNCNS